MDRNYKNYILVYNIYYIRKDTFRDVFILHKQLQKILYLIDTIRKININENFRI